MKKLVISLTLGLALAFAILMFLSRKNHQAPIISIGLVTYVDHKVLNSIESSFRERLEELLIDPKSVIFLRGNAQGRKENVPETVSQVLAGHPDVLVTISTPVSQSALRMVDSQQKVVFSFVTNPSDLGDELTRANCTGVSDAVNYGANLKLIRRILPNAKALGYVYNPNEANSMYGVTLVRQLAPQYGFVVIEGTVADEKEVTTVARQVANNCDALYVGGDNTVVGAIAAVCAAGLEKSKPVFASDVGSIESGAIAGVSVDYNQLGILTANVVFEVIRGKEPRDIPRVVLPGDQLIVNKRLAERFKIVIPDDVLKDAQRQID